MFEDGLFYTDDQIARAFAVTPGTIYNWRQSFSFPPGELFGRARRTRGQRINAWIADRPRDKARLAPGMGGRGRGRPRKTPTPNLTAA
jgi:hypothetical protein